MSDRNLIFNAKGAQIGYIEGERAFDLTGRERCNYTPATGNLSELHGKKIVGHISLDGIFVGLAWISDQLFGVSSGEVYPNSTLAGKQQPHLPPKKPNAQRSEKLGVKEPMGVSLRNATQPQPENVVEHSPAILKIGGDAETVSNAK
jgi:hypothetical protein